MMWGHLKHPNIAHIWGSDIDVYPPIVASKWMPNGNLTAYITEHPEANRAELVCVPFLSS